VDPKHVLAAALFHYGSADLIDEYIARVTGTILDAMADKFNGL